MLLDHKFRLIPTDLAEITGLGVMEGFGLCPGEFLDDSFVLSGFIFFFYGSEEEEMLHTHHRRGGFVFVCVFSQLASAGLLAEGTCRLPLWPRI